MLSLYVLYTELVNNLSTRSCYDNNYCSGLRFRITSQFFRDAEAKYTGQTVGLSTFSVTCVSHFIDIFGVNTSVAFCAYEYIIYSCLSRVMVLWKPTVKIEGPA